MQGFTRRSSYLRTCFVALALILTFLLVKECNHRSEKQFKGGATVERIISKVNITIGRKLLATGAEKTNQIGDSCSKDDIVVYQGATTPLPNGIPTYTVQILNVCVAGCTISGIHVSCGWFSSARMINPKVFRRLRYDDCLVNDGAPLRPGGSISFQYANTFCYPLSVSSVACS